VSTRERHTHTHSLSLTHTHTHTHTHTRARAHTHSHTHTHAHTFSRYFDEFTRADNTCLIVHSTYWDNEVWHKLMGITLRYIEQGIRWVSVTDVWAQHPDEVE
jgi:hypothetical protein